MVFPLESACKPYVGVPPSAVGCPSVRVWRVFQPKKRVSLPVINKFSSPHEGVLHNTTTNIWV